jgi:phage terminase large subunit GpA-like protein
MSATAQIVPTASSDSASAIADVRRRAMLSLLPPPRLSLPDWIESEVRLPAGVSATPGKVRLWKPQRGIAEAIGDPTIERVSVLKGVRVGYSTLLTAAVASFAANEPSPILLLMPTESDARDVVVSDIEPTFEATPAIRGMLSADADETGRNTLLHRRFPGGSLKIVAAKSPRNLRRHNVRVLLIDECDAMESGAEGSPIMLAEKRTLSFGNRKIVMGSTPVYEETSHILRAYAASDRRVFEVPCPECGSFNEIGWKDIQWEPDRPETAHYVCPDCGSVIEERHKAAMVEAGRWRATAPDVKGHAGFRINCLISTLPNAAWGNLAAEFLAAKKSPDTLQTFVNTILAEPWREAAEELDEAELAARAEPFGLPDSIPTDVLVVTAGVDVQRDRLELVYLGHGRAETFVLGNSVIWGSPDEDTTWQELDDALRTHWKHPSGGLLKVDAAAVDAGDGETMDAVTAFCKPRFGRRVVAIKGASGNRPAILASRSKGSRLFIVGVDGLKSQLTSRLSRGRTIRFSQNLEPRFYEEIASERLVVRYVRGAPVRQWERIPGRRAECLDATVYALAVRGLVSLDLDRREAELQSHRIPDPMPVVIKSKWLSNKLHVI